MPTLPPTPRAPRSGTLAAEHLRRFHALSGHAEYWRAEAQQCRAWMVKTRRSNLDTARRFAEQARTEYTRFLAALECEILDRLEDEVTA